MPSFHINVSLHIPHARNRRRHPLLRIPRRFRSNRCSTCGRAVLCTRIANARTVGVAYYPYGVSFSTEQGQHLDLRLQREHRIGDKPERSICGRSGA